VGVWYLVILPGVLLSLVAISAYSYILLRCRVSAVIGVIPGANIGYMRGANRFSKMNIYK
jgi:hypothetical protein